MGGFGASLFVFDTGGSIDITGVMISGFFRRVMFGLRTTVFFPGSGAENWLL